MTAKTGTLYWLNAIGDKTFPNATIKLLAIGLADHVNERDACFPSVRALAAWAMCSERTARTHLNRMEELGLFTRSRRHGPGGHLTTYEYVLNRGGFEALSDLSGPLAANLAAGPPSGKIATPSGKSCGPSGNMDCRAELPSTELPIENYPGIRDIAADLVDPHDDPEYRFDDFWGIYPRRNGKRLGKAKSLDRWRRLNYETKALAFRGVVNYAEHCTRTDTFPKDPERWLLHRCWEDWQDGPGGMDKPISTRERRIVANGMSATFMEAAGFAVPEVLELTS